MQIIKMKPANLRVRLKASALHLGISVVVAALAAGVVFGVWYPFPYRELSGGRELFQLLVSVDIVVGPIITLVIFNTAKPRAELIRDLVTVAALQLSALSYGLWTVYQARPVHLVFEIDRFRVVDAVDVPHELLGSTPSGVVALPLTGPTVLAIRPFRNLDEDRDDTIAALQGLQLGARPDLWEDYQVARPQIFLASRSVADLKARFPDRSPAIDAAVLKTGLPADQLRYVPLASRKLFWTVLIDGQSADVRGFIDLDSF